MPVNTVQWVKASGPQVLLQAQSHLLRGSNECGLLLIFKQPWWIFHKLSMQFATSCFNYDQSSKCESCWTAECAFLISQRTRMSQSSLLQRLMGNWGFGYVIQLWRTLLVMNVGKMCTLTKITLPQRHMDLHLMNINWLCFSMLRHGKGLQSLSEQSKGRKNILLLKD